MNKDDKIIAMLRDTIERCESKSTKPKQGRYLSKSLTILTMILASLTLFYGDNNQQLEAEIASLKMQYGNQTPPDIHYYQGVLLDEFVVEKPEFKCDDGLIQTFPDGAPVCQSFI